MEQIIKIPSEILEQMIISYSLHNASFFLKIKNHLSTKNYKHKCYFNDEKNQIIFNIITRWYDRYSSFPSIKEMRLFVEKIGEDEEIKSLLMVMIERYYEEDTTKYNEQHLTEETKDYIIQQRIIEAIALSQEDIDKGSYAEIANRMKDAISVNFDKDLGTSIKDDLKVVERINSSLKGDNYIQIGMPTLDRTMGGFFPQEITVVAGTPGIGKCAHKSVKITVEYEIDDSTGEII